jgi:hypothetical protein
MVDERQPEQVTDDLVEEEMDEDDQGGSEPDRLTQAVRRERLASLQSRIGEHAQQDGDVIVIEAGEPVVLHIELDRDGTYALTWWATSLSEHGHHRWRDAATTLLRDHESIHTSALGGGYLLEIEQTSRDEDEVVQLANDPERAERVRELVTAFPQAVAALPEEPIPDYLLPPEPELPLLGEADAEDVADDSSDEDDGQDTGQ